MSLALYKQITEQAAEELRLAADRFEQISAAAEAKLQAVLEQYEREMQDKIREDR